MADRIAIEDLTTAMLEAYTRYTTEVVEELEQELQRIAQEAVAEVKKLSPKDKGRYRRSWRSLVERSNGKIHITVHNRIYQLTHLLEDGYVSADGTNWARAFPHISIANKHAEEKIDKFLEEL